MRGPIVWSDAAIVEEAPHETNEPRPEAGFAVFKKWAILDLNQCLYPYQEYALTI